MPSFDGDPVKIGDRLYDTYFQKQVSVLQIYSDRIVVSVPTIGSRTYSYGGTMAGKNLKTLYWFNPVVVIPRKDPDAWARQSNTLRALMHILAPAIGNMVHVDELSQDLDHSDPSIIQGMSVPRGDSL